MFDKKGGVAVLTRGSRRSLHEVATDPTDPDLAYLSYYSGGLRAVRDRQRRSSSRSAGYIEAPVLSLRASAW